MLSVRGKEEEGPGQVEEGSVKKVEEDATIAE